MNPTEVLALRNKALLENDAEAFSTLFASDGVIETPFAANGMPPRLEGREAIRAFSARTFPAMRIEKLDELAVHQTQDPEVLIVEGATTGRLTGSGQPFSGRSINVFRIRDGKILLFRTYAGLAAPATPEKQ